MPPSRDVFEIVIDHRIEWDAYIVGWRSRVFGQEQRIQIRHGWGADPNTLAQYIERFVGGHLRLIAEHAEHGRAMVEHLMPFFEREIHRFMERLEVEHRHRFRPQYEYLHFGQEYLRREPTPHAVSKAKKLLVDQLNEEQKADFEKFKKFDVKAADGRIYTISHDRSFNVKGPDGVKYCGQLEDAPIEDQMLAQKLLLEHDPNKFFKNANKQLPSSQHERNLTAQEVMARQEQFYRSYVDDRYRWSP